MLKLLVPVDFSDITNAVLRTVKRIVQKHGGEVILFHAVSPAIYIPYPEGFGVEIIDVNLLKQIEDSKKKEALEKLQALRDYLSYENVKTMVEVGDPRDLILEVEEKEKPDLTVVGSHKKGLIEKILIGSTTEKVVKHSRSPILILKGLEPSFERKVLIAYDFSKTAEKMVDFAIRFLKPFDVKIVILHVEEPIDIPIIEKIGRAIYKKYKEEKRKHMDRLKMKLSEEGFEVETRILEDADSAEGIVNVVSEDESVDLIIMGSKGLSGLKRILLGSTSTEVFRRSEKPLLIFKEAER